MVGNVVIFLLPHNGAKASIYVRAKCIEEFAPLGWNFKYVGGCYPVIFDFPILRNIYKWFSYITFCSAEKVRSFNVTIVIIKPTSHLLILVLQKLLKLKVVVDVNDPIHLPEFNGLDETRKILKYANHIIFESIEYKNYWPDMPVGSSTIVEDTPQHECLYINYKNRKKQIIWIGSPETSNVLFDCVNHLAFFNKMGYVIKLLGPSESLVKFLRTAGIKISASYFYDEISLAEELSNSMISFVPMPDVELFNLRGNLKAKLSMGYGAMTIASKNSMHDRLISSGTNGILFSTFADFVNKCEGIITNMEYCAKLAVNGNRYICDNFTRSDHAIKIVKICEHLK